MTKETTSTDERTDRISTLRNSGVSRRGFLTASAAVGAGVGAFGSITPVAGHDSSNSGSDDDDHDEGDGVEHDKMDMSGDIEILNFARTLEFLEARFYREGLDTIGREGLHCSNPLQAVGGPVQDRAFDDLRVIQEHEEIHAEVLGETITNLGGEPVAEPEFEFGTATEDPVEFLATAALLEMTGVGAYAGAAPEIENPDLIPPALSIHSVEARHTSFLNVLNGEIGFPAAFDEALSMDEVLERANQFIVE